MEKITTMKRKDGIVAEALQPYVQDAYVVIRNGVEMLVDRDLLTVTEKAAIVAELERQIEEDKKRILALEAWRDHGVRTGQLNDRPKT